MIAIHIGRHGRDLPREAARCKEVAIALDRVGYWTALFVHSDEGCDRRAKTAMTCEGTQPR